MSWYISAFPICLRNGTDIYLRQPEREVFLPTFRNHWAVYYGADWWPAGSSHLSTAYCVLWRFLCFSACLFYTKRKMWPQECWNNSVWSVGGFYKVWKWSYVPVLATPRMGGSWLKEKVCVCACSRIYSWAKHKFPLCKSLNIKVKKHLSWG